MLFFFKLVGKTKIPKSQKYTNAFKQNLTCMFLPVRANLNYTLCNEGPCILPSEQRVSVTYSVTVEHCCSFSVTHCLSKTVLYSVLTLSRHSFLGIVWQTSSFVVS